MAENQGACGAGDPSPTDGQPTTSLKVVTPKIPSIFFQFQFKHLKKIIKAKASFDEQVLTVLRSTMYFKTELEKSKKKGLLIHASERLKAMVKGNLPCRLLPPGELLKIILIRQEQPEEVNVHGRDLKLFCVAAKGETENGDRRKILSCGQLKKLNIPLAVSAPEHQTLLKALKDDGRFEGKHFTNLFYLRPSDNSGDSEPYSKVGHLKDSAITYTLIVTRNRLLESNQPQEENLETVEAGQGDNTSTPQLGVRHDTTSKTSIDAQVRHLMIPMHSKKSVQKPEMPTGVQHRFETWLLEKYKNLKLQGELLSKAFREEKNKKGGAKGHFEICIEKFGKEIKNVTPIAVHELLADLGRSVGYIEWHNEMGIRGGYATCFVLHGPYIITNDHVIWMIVGKEAAGAQWSMVSAKVAKLARVSFNYKKSFPSKDDWFFIESLLCCNTDLDYAVLQLKEKEGIPPALIKKIRNDISDELIYIIGHPDGGPKATDTCKIISYSKRTSEFDERLKKRRPEICNPVYCGGVFPNEDIDCFHILSQKSAEDRDKNFPLLQNPDALAYDTSFFEGSSGSPVFSSSGALIALHAAGCRSKYEWSKQYIIEFGFSINAIRIDIETNKNRPFSECNNKMEVDI